MLSLCLFVVVVVVFYTRGCNGVIRPSPSSPVAILSLFFSLLSAVSSCWRFDSVLLLCFFPFSFYMIISPLFCLFDLVCFICFLTDILLPFRSLVIAILFTGQCLSSSSSLIVLLMWWFRGG
eukprot:GCRY01004810.1.p2 GENE.GCRY01004810.1~~GCRY01004810.1.p2  ORF type:complete len:122 (+),score=16.35 GCRY01004810.1:275-640(+)